MPTDLTHLYKRLLFGEYKIPMRSPAENLCVIIIIMLLLLWLSFVLEHEL